MGKKEKAACALAEDFKAIPAMISKLEAFIKIHKEISVGYQKYRKNGGEAISGVEKYLGVPEKKATPPVKKKETPKKAEVVTTEEITEKKAPKKKVKK